jgi:glycogen debranching enzyme
VVHDWPEYYDGRTGRLIGRRANLNQVWSAAGFILSHKLMDNPELLAMFPGQPVMEHV